MLEPSCETRESSDGITWMRVVFADECRRCELCGDAVCPNCQIHYAECACPGPSQDEIYWYSEDGSGVLWASLVDQ